MSRSFQTWTEKDSGAFSGNGTQATSTQDHVTRKHERQPHQMGQPSPLTQQTEEKLADNLKHMEKHGFRFIIKEKLELIGDYLKTSAIPSRFKSGSPGGSWFAQFANRNGLPKPQPKQQFVLFEDYFNTLKGTIEDNDLKDPGKIWYIDETTFNITEETITRTNDDDNATVLTACNAAGQKGPVFIILQEKMRPRDLISNKDVCYAGTENGLLGKSGFRDYFIKSFLRRVRNAPPIVIAYNGQSSHIGIKLIEETRAANIIFLNIPNVLKEYSIFDDLKHKWDANLVHLKGGDLVKRFCDVIISDFNKFTADVIKDGFRKVGICPFDDSVTVEKYGEDFVKKWREYEIIYAAGVESKIPTIDSVVVEESDEVTVKEEREESILPEQESSSATNEIISQSHLTHEACFVKYLEDNAHISMSVSEASSQTPESRKRPAPVSDHLELPKVTIKQSRTHWDPKYGALIKVARTIREPRTVCCVFGCRNSVRLDPDKDFFPLPTQPERYLNWLKLINRGDLADKLGSGARDHYVCSDHFDDADFAGDTLNDEATPHLKLPVKTNVEYAVCDDETAEIKIEPDDYSEGMEVEICFEPLRHPIVTSRTPVMPHTPEDKRQNTSVPAILNTTKIVHSTPSAPATVVQIETDEIPTFKIPKPQKTEPEEAKEPLKIENFEITAFSINKKLINTKPAADRLKTIEEYLKNASITCIEHVSLPIEVETKSVLVQTTKDLIDKMYAPLKKKYAQELREAKEKLERVEAESTKPNMVRSKFIESCENFLDEKVANIVKSHAYLLEKSKGNRHSQNFKLFALNLYLCSPQSYKFVEQFFFLPSITTIHRLQIPIRTGFNEKLMHSFKIKVNQMSEKEKMCTVCFDYVDVNRNLYYDVRNDFICGLHEIDQIQGSQPAKCAPIIMVRGMYSKWRQPVSFALVSEKKCYPELKIWLHKTIALLFDIGLNVKAFIVNQDTEFLDFSDISSDEPFTVSGRKIYQIFDVPFLFKNARDDFLKYEFNFGSKVAKLDHVMEVYNADQQHELRLMPKITDQHLSHVEDSDNDVKFSIELFSRTVAAALNFHVNTKMVVKEAADTVIFIELMNNLFDMLNSSTLSSDYEFKKAYRGTEEQNQFFDAALEFLQQLIMVDKDGHVIEKISFVTGLLTTIKSLVNLIQDLQKENVKYLLTKNLSKDCMEIYFNRVRELSGTAHARPTSIMFSRAFKRLFLMNLVSSVKKGCTEVDLESTVAKISDYVKLDVDWRKEDEDSNRSLIVGILDYQKLWPAPSTHFIAGYLLWKCLEKHSCELLESTLCVQYDMEINIDELKEKLKEFNSKNMKNRQLLRLPLDITQFVERLDNIFEEYAANREVSMFGFGGFIYSKMETETFLIPCDCFPLKFMKYLFIRIKIFHMLKEFNLKNKPTRHSRAKKTNTK